MELFPKFQRNLTSVPSLLFNGNISRPSIERQQYSGIYFQPEQLFRNTSINELESAAPMEPQIFSQSEQQFKNMTPYSINNYHRPYSSVSNASPNFNNTQLFAQPAGNYSNAAPYSFGHNDSSASINPQFSSQIFSQPNGNFQSMPPYSINDYESPPIAAQQMFFRSETPYSSVGYESSLSDSSPLPELYSQQEEYYSSATPYSFGHNDSSALMEPQLSPPTHFSNSSYSSDRYYSPAPVGSQQSTEQNSQSQINVNTPPYSIDGSYSPASSFDDKTISSDLDDLYKQIGLDQQTSEPTSEEELLQQLEESVTLNGGLNKNQNVIMPTISIILEYPTLGHSEHMKCEINYDGPSQNVHPITTSEPTLPSSTSSTTLSETDTSNFQCECGRKFRTLFYLKQHREVHEDRSYRCTECGKRFIHEHELTEHFARHTGPKSFKCPHCPKGYVHKTDFRRHMQKHIGNVPYKCEVCKITSSRRDHYKAHLRTRKHLMNASAKSTTQ